MALLGAALIHLAGCDKLSGDDCMGSGPATVAKYADCTSRCSGGESDACNQRSEVESALSQACHIRAAKDACKALCDGRKKDRSACDRFRQLVKGN